MTDYLLARKLGVKTATLAKWRRTFRCLAQARNGNARPEPGAVIPTGCLSAPLPAPDGLSLVSALA